MESEITTLDLFSGVGGFSLGLETAGPFRTVAFCEQDPFCQAVLRKHWPDTPIYDDVRTIEFDGECDVITSGDPCQRDSRANVNRDGESMWPWTLKQVQRHQPLYVIRENVLGNIDTGTLEQVESDLEREGYHVRSYIIHASAIGAAHDRPRTWTLAYSDSAGRQEFDHAAVASAPEQRKYPVLTGPDGLCWMGTEPPVLRRDDDVPHRLDRIRALGNAVVPQVVEQIGRAIIQHGFKPM
jgi:DNA (cytosine-5)-methyltransferase 1